MFVIDREGKLVYEGALDDDPEGNAPRLNYVQDAISSLLAGNAPRNTETKPYGCPVKTRD